jgi:hypothetical protein
MLQDGPESAILYQDTGCFADKRYGSLMPKKHFSFAIRILLTAAFIYLGAEQTAYAYLDPGSGSFIFQVLVGMGLLFLSGWKMLLGGIKRIISRIFPKKK